MEDDREDTSAASLIISSISVCSQRSFWMCRMPPWSDLCHDYTAKREGNQLWDPSSSRCCGTTPRHGQDIETGCSLSETKGYFLSVPSNFGMGRSRTAAANCAHADAIPGGPTSGAYAAKSESA